MTTESRSLLLVWHSRTGAAKQLAAAAAKGARDSLRETGAPDMPRSGSHGDRLRIECVHARHADARRVCAAAGYIFVAPENLAALSGVMKDFFDRTYYGVLDRVGGRPYALIIAAGSDGQGAARQAERIATGWRLKAVAPPLIVITRAQTPEAILAPKRVALPDLARAAELGAAMAEGLALGIF